MEELALKEVYSLFPKIDGDSSKILLILVSTRELEGELNLIDIMEKCQFEGLHNVFLPKEIQKFFEGKCDVLKTLEIQGSTGFSNVFDYIDVDDTKMKFCFSKFFYGWSVKK